MKRRTIETKNMLQRLLLLLMRALLHHRRRLSRETRCYGCRKFLGELEVTHE